MNARIMRRHDAWHKQQLDEVLAGPHGAAVARVMKFLNENMHPQSAPALIALLHEHDWGQMDADVRFVVLHEINSAITRLRERENKLPFDDPLPPHAHTAFLIARTLLASRKIPPGNSGTSEEKLK
jgi:hypothetical protein